MLKQGENNMSKKDEYNFGGIVSNDARNRMQNTPGDGMAPIAPPNPVAPVAPVMAPKIEKPVGLGNQGNSTDAYVDPYNEDIAPVLTDGGMYKEGGAVEKKRRTTQENHKIALKIGDKSYKLGTIKGTRKTDLRGTPIDEFVGDVGKAAKGAVKTFTPIAKRAVAGATKVLKETKKDFKSNVKKQIEFKKKQINEVKQFVGKIKSKLKKKDKKLKYEDTDAGKRKK